jgi:hypothetical protein
LISKETRGLRAARLFLDEVSVEDQAVRSS